MKRYILLALCIATATTARSQTATVCPWDNDRKAAVVLTFDDWSPGQYPIAVPELQARNISGTFYVMLNTIASWNHPWSAVVATAAAGNEIGNHTKTHPTLTDESAEALSNQIRDMKRIIDTNVSSQKTLTFAYPFGASNAAIIDSVKNSGHIAARNNASSGDYTYGFATTEDDYFRLSTYLMNGETTTNDFYQEIANVINGGGLLTYMYHSLDDTDGTYGDTWYGQVLQDSLRKQLDTLLSVKDEVWITTLVQAVTYHREAACATITEVSPFDGAQWVIDLTDTLSDYSIYDQPLSIKVHTNGIQFSAIHQAGNPLSIDTAYNDVIVFHAVPDGGAITLTGSVVHGNRYWIGRSLYQCTFSTPSGLDEWQPVEDNGTGAWYLSGNGTAVLQMDDEAGGYAVRLFNESSEAMIFPLDAANGVVELEVAALTGVDQRFFIQVQEFDSDLNYITEQTILPPAGTPGYHAVALHTVTWNPATVNVRFIIAAENHAGRQGTLALNYFNYANTDSRWDNPVNWSATSGGPGGASAPVSSDTAVFDGVSGYNGLCHLAAPLTVAGITVSGYAGAIDLRGNDLAVTSNVTVATGNITDSQGTGSIIINTPGTLAFGGTAFNTPVNVTAGAILLNGSVFNKAALFTHTGAGPGVGAGGNLFNAATTFTNTGAGTLRLANATGDTFNGDVTFVQTPGTIEPAYNGANTFNGNLAVHGSLPITLGSGAGVVTLAGAGDQSIGADGPAAPVIHRLTVNKTGGAVTLNSVVTVSTAVTFTNGIVRTTAANYLNVADNATVSGASHHSYVDGPVRKVGDDAFTFPVGDGSVYRPIGISAPLAATDAFTARYFKEAQPYGSTLDATLATASTCEYWTLDRDAGASDVWVTLSWVSSACSAGYITDPGTLQVGHWNGALWENLGSSGTTGDASSGTVTTLDRVSAFSPFTLVSTSFANPLPIVLSSFRAVNRDHTVALYWTTASELNNDFFTIERAANGLDFEPIGQVDGAGTAHDTQQYTFTDDGPYPGLSYYRLKQTDFDGRFSHSRKVTVQRSGYDPPLIVHPNPVRTGEAVRLNQAAVIEVINQLGQTLLRTAVTDRLENSLPPGLYILRTQEGVTTRLVVY